jgi:phosphate butyryltransferase
MDMVYTSLDQLITRARGAGGSKKVVAVVAAEDSHTLEAVSQAVKDGLLSAMLIGNREKISQRLRLIGENPSDYGIVHADDAKEAVLKAAELIRSGHADFLMKGLVQTGDLLRIMVSNEGGLRTGRLMSHLSIVQIPNYHKLIGLTDVAVNIEPTLDQKKAIIENAVETMLRMGFETPKVAILASSETVNPKMKDSVDAGALKKMNIDGLIERCVIEGPISYDLAISRESAEIKGFESSVAGDVDLMVVPNMTAGNILLKALRYSAEASSAGIVIGGKVPIVLTSRAVETQDKYLPLALAASAVM